MENACCWPQAFRSCLCHSSGDWYWVHVTSCLIDCRCTRGRRTPHALVCSQFEFYGVGCYFTRLPNEFECYCQYSGFRVRCFTSTEAGPLVVALVGGWQCRCRYVYLLFFQREFSPLLYHVCPLFQNCNIRIDGQFLHSQMEWKYSVSCSSPTTLGCMFRMDGHFCNYGVGE